MNNIEEVLADLFVNSEGSLYLKIDIKNNDGLLILTQLENNLNKPDKSDYKEIDFELSLCECSGLIETDLSDYKNKLIYTSSALEFFDFVFSSYKTIVCKVDFNDGAWKIEVVDYN
ncbi:MAG: hypothetical protein GTO02_03755 [Candidatus Dadabacteria bacterium]|nr:hypothetical protein [Candidatus Dadabacteria bacterium]